MQNQVSPSTFFFFLFAIVVLILVITALGIYHLEILKSIGVFFENLTAQKVAKRLNMVDKGRVQSVLRTEVDKEGNRNQRHYRLLHIFCNSPIRIAILNKRAVKWCSMCEFVFPDDEGGGGGKDGEDGTPDDPVPPGVKIATDSILDRIKNRDVTKDVK